MTCSHRVSTWAPLLALLALAGLAHAGDMSPTQAQQRERLARERAAAQARYERAVTACEQGFIVTSCINAAKAERRATLDRVSREQAALDDAARRRRADERRRRIAAKQQAAAARAASSPASAQPTLQAPRPAASSAGTTRPRRPVMPRSEDEAAALDAEAAARAAKARARRDKAEAHAEAVRARNAQRALQRPPAAPLPAPAASR